MSSPRKVLLNHNNCTAPKTAPFQRERSAAPRARLASLTPVTEPACDCSPQASF